MSFVRVIIWYAIAPSPKAHRSSPTFIAGLLRFRNVLSGTFNSVVDSSFDALDLILYT